MSGIGRSEDEISIYDKTIKEKVLALRAREGRRKVSEAVQEAVDSYLVGVTANELQLLDVATKRAREDIDAMNTTLGRVLARAEGFFAEIEQIRQA